MAEIAAGALVAEQVVSTALQVGAAASIARPTLPLKASLSQISTSPPPESLPALARAHHTVTVIGDKAYIFGGEQAGGKLCDVDVHAVSLPTQKEPTAHAEYACYTAFAVKDAATGELQVPSPRKGHAACARGKYLVVHGGSDENGTPIAEEACIWLWDSETLRWTKVQAATQMGETLAPRAGHSVFVDEKQELMVLHGGSTASGQTGETWLYDFNAVAWTQLPSSPAPPEVSAFAGNALYSLSSDSELGGSIHVLKVQPSETERAKPDALKWEKVDFPTNPFVPGPKSRTGAALVPVSTGYGRYYLVYLLGQTAMLGKENDQQPFRSDVWSLQIPSRGFNPAAVKDAIRDKLPRSVDSGTYRWAEVEIVPTEQLEHEGKVHPGPRGFFGASPCLGGKSVVFWGGLNAKREQEGDGWLLKIQ